MKIGLLTTLFALLAGCASYDTSSLHRKFYNVVTQGESKFNNLKYTRVKNIACADDGTIIRMDLYQDEKQRQQDKIILTVKTPIHSSIATNNSLHFKIDGATVGLSSIDKITKTEKLTEFQSAGSFYARGVYLPTIYAPATYAATKRYIVNRALIERFTKANTLLVKVDLERSFIEGDCSIPVKSKEKEEYHQAAVEASGVYGFQEFIKATK